MIDQTNKRVHTEGLLKRKIVEEGSQSDSQFIRGSKGCSSFTQPVTPKSTRKRLKQDLKSETFNIPNQLKSVFYSQENSFQPISLNTKASPKRFSASLPNFASIGNNSSSGFEQLSNTPFQITNGASFQYSEDDIFRPSVLPPPNNANTYNKSTTNESFHKLTMSTPRNTRNTNQLALYNPPPTPTNNLFNTSFESDNGNQEFNPSISSPIKHESQTNNDTHHFPPRLDNTSDFYRSFQFEEQKVTQDAKFKLFRQPNSREQLDLFSPVHHQNPQRYQTTVGNDNSRSTSVVPNHTTNFSSLFSQFE